MKEQKVKCSQAIWHRDQEYFEVAFEQKSVEPIGRIDKSGDPLSVSVVPRTNRQELVYRIHDFIGPLR